MIISCFHLDKHTNRILLTELWLTTFVILFRKREGCALCAICNEFKEQFGITQTVPKVDKTVKRPPFVKKH